MQLINLTVYKRNGVLATQTIAVDVDDLASPIRFNTGNKSYFSLLIKIPYEVPRATIEIVYEVNQTLSAIQALSSKLLLLTVLRKNKVSLPTSEQMVFNASLVSGPFLTVPEGTSFSYCENGSPNTTEYVVSESIATIMAQQASVGAIQESIIAAASDETTLLTTGTAKVTFRMPYTFTLTKVKASLNTAPGGGGISIFTVDVNKNGVTIFSTKITIDPAETTSETAAIPSVLATTAFANDDVITVDIDSIDGGAGTGLKVTLIGNQ